MIDQPLQGFNYALTQRLKTFPGLKPNQTQSLKASPGLKPNQTQKLRTSPGLNPNQTQSLKDSPGLNPNQTQRLNPRNSPVLPPAYQNLSRNNSHSSEGNSIFASLNDVLMKEII